nr:hypothetical protein CFP56_34758 [Quercus suber]
MGSQIKRESNGFPEKVQGAADGILASIHGYAHETASQGQVLLDRTFPPEQRDAISEKLQTFISANPKLSVSASPLFFRAYLGELTRELPIDVPRNQSVAHRPPTCVLPSLHDDCHTVLPYRWPSTRLVGRCAFRTPGCRHCSMRPAAYHFLHDNLRMLSLPLGAEWLLHPELGKWWKGRTAGKVSRVTVAIVRHLELRVRPTDEVKVPSEVLRRSKTPPSHETGTEVQVLTRSVQQAWVRRAQYDNPFDGKTDNSSDEGSHFANPRNPRTCLQRDQRRTRTVICKRRFRENVVNVECMPGSRSGDDENIGRAEVSRPSPTDTLAHMHAGVLRSRSILDAAMIAATRRWFKRNRTNLFIGAGVIGAGYLAGQYVLGKIQEARQRMSEERVSKEK